MNIEFPFLGFSSFKLAEPEITGVKALSCLGIVDVERKSQSPKGLSTGAWPAGGVGDRRPGTQPPVERTTQPPDAPQTWSGEGLCAPGGSVARPVALIQSPCPYCVP